MEKGIVYYDALLDDLKENEIEYVECGTTPICVADIVAQLQNHFHVSAAEIDEQDTHQIIVIGAAAIVPHNAIADHLMDEISTFVEMNTEAEILDEQREIR